jgi:hypothetical protein
VEAGWLRTACAATGGRVVLVLPAVVEVGPAVVGVCAVTEKGVR